MSGKRVTLLGDGMSAIVQGIAEVGVLVGATPVVIGGLAVMARLSTPYRATTDLDVVDRMIGNTTQLELLRAAKGAEAIEPAAVMLMTAYGSVKVDVLEVRQIELDDPSDNAGDRLHASAHAWAFDSASPLTIEVLRLDGDRIEVTTPVAEPGPLIAMKLQAIMDRGAQKQGTDLQDIVRLTLDAETRPVALRQLAGTSADMASDIAQHVDLWLIQRQAQSLKWVHGAGGVDLVADDLGLTADLLLAACARSIGE